MRLRLWLGCLLIAAFGVSCSTDTLVSPTPSNTAIQGEEGSASAKFLGCEITSVVTPWNGSNAQVKLEGYHKFRASNISGTRIKTSQSAVWTNLNKLTPWIVVLTWQPYSDPMHTVTVTATYDVYKFTPTGQETVCTYTAYVGQGAPPLP